MRRLLLLTLASGAVAAFVAAGAAGATHECKGLEVCVPVAGPWVLAPARAETHWQLSCPKHFVVGGLDAELTTRAIDIAFRAKLGSPVNPGISTSTAAVFLARLVVGRDPAASFRPYIGCIPSKSSGSRVPTVHHKLYPPGNPAVVRASNFAVRAGSTHRVTRACRRGEHLVTSSDAIGFYGKRPPSRTLARAVHARLTSAGHRATVTIRGGSLGRGVHAVVQLDLLCAVGR